MKMYRLTKQYNSEINRHSDYIGFHCQKRPRSQYDDIIVNESYYAENAYIHILDSLPFDVKNKASNMGLFEMPEKQTEEFDEWANKVYEFLTDYNIRWIYVSHNKPLSDHYGDYRYYVLLPESCILDIFDDPHVNDLAWAYLYDANKCSPTCIELTEEEDGFDENL